MTQTTFSLRASHVPLKYLFTATFADGSTIAQTLEDKSATLPGKSAFTDVLARAKTTALVAFVVRGEGHEYGVDLRDGHFEVDGMPFRMHDDQPKGFELVYFRGVRIDWEQSKYLIKEKSHTVTHNIGWKAIGAQNYQRVMQLD